jgi:iron complex transport system substrate-binding protein
MKNKPSTLVWSIIVSIAIFVIVMTISVLRKPVAGKGSGGGSMRIISLAPNITEMLFVLGVEDSVVGRTDHCDYPPEAAKIETVGSLGLANIEKVLSLHPDLLITPNEPDQEIRQLLERAEIEILVIQSNTVHGMLEHLKSIGDAVDTGEVATEVIAAMQSRLDKIASRYDGLNPAQRPRVFIEISSDPMITVGQSSFINDVIVCAGGVNVAGEINKSYPHINPEKVIAWNPDIILPCYMGDTSGVYEQMSQRIGWEDITAIKTGRVIEDFPSDLIMRAGPRLIEGIEVLSQHLSSHMKREVVCQ